MAILIEEGEASEEVLAVYADIKVTRKTDWVNNFWKALANHPATLKRIWENIKQVMAPGALDSLTKELVYIAVSVTNNCGYCIASHTAAARAFFFFLSFFFFFFFFFSFNINFQPKINCRLPPIDGVDGTKPDCRKEPQPGLTIDCSEEPV